MDVRQENDKPRYWKEVVDEKTGVRRVTVAAEITVTFDKLGIVAKMRGSSLLVEVLLLAV